jgi:diketogulonate reductase-like aldo/keto reductase
MQEKAVKLESGHRMPVLGLGTWQMAGKVCEETVRKALELGYRHIDTAEAYGNQKEIGRAMKGFDRPELFLVSKAWTSNLGRDKIIRACERTLRELGTSYLDLYLIHWPNESVPISETMAGMEELVKSGMVRSIGISNFDARLTKEAMDASGIPVSVNQVEFHPHLYQKELLGFCSKHGIVVTAYCPLARGEALTDATIMEIAESHGKTPAQVSLRWLVQHGLVVIPKTVSEAHLKENMDIFGWRLSAADMKKIDSIGISKRQVNPVYTNVPFFVVRAAQKFLH